VSPSLHILLVDDLPEIGELLSTILHADGHATSYCRSGAEALHQLRSSTRPYDLLITDHFMPGSITGLDLVRLARARGFDRQIVATSGNFSPELKESYKAFAVLGFLPKPMDIKLLKALVQATRLVPRPSHGLQSAGHASPPDPRAQSLSLLKRDAVEPIECRLESEIESAARVETAA
jgi:CheY-like chemotaxis protein